MPNRSWCILLFCLALIGTAPAYASNDARSDEGELPCNALCRSWMGFGRETPAAPTDRVSEATAPAPAGVPVPDTTIPKPVSRVMPEPPRHATERAKPVPAHHPAKVLPKPRPAPAEPLRAAIQPALKPMPVDAPAPIVMDPAPASVAPAIVPAPAAAEAPAVPAAATATVERLAPDASAATGDIGWTAAVESRADPRPVSPPSSAQQAGDETAAVTAVAAPVAASRPASVGTVGTPLSVKLGFYAVMAMIVGWSFRRRGEGAVDDSDTGTRRQPVSQAWRIDRHHAAAEAA